MAHRAKNRKPWTIAVLAVLLTVAVMASVNVTYAYLFTNTNSAENVFVPAVVDCEVNEDFVNNVKSDVCVKNIGTAEAYVRMALVVTWQDANGNCLAVAPVLGQDYTAVFNETDWFFHNGFWYCKAPVAVGFDSQILVEEFKPTGLNQPEGYQLSLQFLASAIQSQPAQSVEAAWGVRVVDGKLEMQLNNF